MTITDEGNLQSIASLASKNATARRIMLPAPTVGRKDSAIVTLKLARASYLRFFASTYVLQELCACAFIGGVDCICGFRMKGGKE